MKSQRLCGLQREKRRGRNHGRGSSQHTWRWEGLPLENILWASYLSFPYWFTLIFSYFTGHWFVEGSFPGAIRLLCWIYLHALSWLYILVSLFFSGKYALILLGVWWVKILLLFLVNSTCISPCMLLEMRLYTFLFCLFSYLTFSPFLLWLLFLFFLFCFWCVWGAKYHSWIGHLLG